jgi:hypothetical protein
MTSLRVRAFILAALCSAAALALVSCATSKGRTLGLVLSSEKGPTTPPSNPPPEDEKGLKIVSDPPSVGVWIDGSFRGLTPVLVEGLAQGWHRVILHKDGWYDSDEWVEFKGDYSLYQATLLRITGFLQADVSPPESSVTIDGESSPSGMLRIPVGTHDVLVRAFGYREFRASVVVRENAVTPLSVVLEPAPFAVTGLSLPRAAVNPDNPGVLGIAEGTMSVTGPGTGEIHVSDSSGADVSVFPLKDFTTWDQTFSWTPRDTSGRALADGTYMLTVVARGAGSEASVSRQVQLRIDRSLKVAARSGWSGSSGLLYAPVSEVLPPGEFQVQVLGAGIVDAAGLFRAPVQLAARIGLSGGVELDAAAGLIASEAIPVFASVASRWNLSSPRSESGTGLAVQAKLALQGVPGSSAIGPLMTDTFANFTGVSVEIPFQLKLGELNLLLSAGAAASLWYPYRYLPDGITVDQSAVAWLYIRAGVMLDLGSITAGVSASTRTEPLPGGVAFLATPVPFAAGAEVHWLVPGTHLMLSGIIAGEYEDDANYYFMGGAGLGFLY